MIKERNWESKKKEKNKKPNKMNKKNPKKTPKNPMYSFRSSLKETQLSFHIFFSIVQKM